MVEIKLFNLSLALLILGFILAFIAVLIPLFSIAVSPREGAGVSVTGSGCVLIMFVPICFGVGEHALPMMVLAVVLAVVVVLLSIFVLRWIYKEIGA